MYEKLVAQPPKPTEQKRTPSSPSIFRFYVLDRLTNTVIRKSTQDVKLALQREQDEIYLRAKFEAVRIAYENYQIALRYTQSELPYSRVDNPDVNTTTAPTFHINLLTEPPSETSRD